jgi:tryptophan-rich sensory protein
MKIEKSKLLVASILLTQLAGFIGSTATTPAIPTWYESLNKPVFNPPNWIFAPVWITLYTLMGVSLYLVWKKGIKDKVSLKGVWYFLIHLVVNSYWSIVFFGQKNLGFGFVVIVTLWLMIAYLINFFFKIDKKASYLLYPYFLWVSFALVLNFSIWQLN